MFILITIGIAVGVMVRTSGFLEGRYRLYVLAESAEGITPDTRVFLQGLQVGRVQQVNPRFDSAANRLDFVVRLSMITKFPDGSPLRLPVGTRAVITQPTSFVGGQVIALQRPAGAIAGFLEPGDTIGSRRTESAMTMLNDVATRLADDISATLEQTGALLARATRAVDASASLVRATGPELEAALAQLVTSLRRADSLVQAMAPRADAVSDSLLVTLADTRVVLARLDTLTRTAQGIAEENRGTIMETLERLQRSAVILEHFSDRISRRPLRLLTGVTPPPADSTERQP